MRAKNDDSTPTDEDEDDQPDKKATPKKSKKDKRTLMPDYDNDGDEWDESENWRGGKYKYPPSSTLYEKMSKENAQYQVGVPFENCGKCTYYQSNHCKIVRGYIAQSMRCMYFQEKYEPQVITLTQISRKRR